MMGHIPRIGLRRDLWGLQRHDQSDNAFGP